MADEPEKPAEPEEDTTGRGTPEPAQDTEPTDPDSVQDSQADESTEQPDTVAEAAERVAEGTGVDAGEDPGEDDEDDEDDVTESSDTIDYFPTLQTKDYNPSEDRERLRGKIAMVLIWSLVIFIAFALFTSWVVMPDSNRQAFLDVLQITLGPLIALVGAVTGFYFGEKSK